MIDKDVRQLFESAGGPESLWLGGCTVKNRNSTPTIDKWHQQRYQLLSWQPLMRATTDHTAHTAEGESWTEQLRTLATGSSVNREHPP